jgi:sec-independent protein translocase protein TatB
MEILGIGPMELFFIVILAIIILGPKDMAKAGRTVGKFLRDVVKSDYYKAFRASSQEIRNLPTRLMREANLEDEIKELDRTLRGAASDLTTNTIRPPTVNDTRPETSGQTTGEPAADPAESPKDQGSEPKA